MGKLTTGQLAILGLLFLGACVVGAILVAVIAGPMLRPAPTPPVVLIATDTATPAPTEIRVEATPTGTPVPPDTPQPGQPTAKANVDLNIRSGPGMVYPVIGWLKAGQSAEITGVNGSWWQIRFSGAADGRGWISAGYTTSENTQNVPVVQAPPRPTDTPTPRPTDTPTPTLTPTPTVTTFPETWTIFITGSVKAPDHLPLSGVEVCFCASGEAEGICSEWRCNTTAADPPELRGIYEVAYETPQCRIPSRYRVTAAGWIPVEEPMPSFGGDCMQSEIRLQMEPIILQPATIPIEISLTDGPVEQPLAGTAWCSYLNPREHPETAVQINIALPEGRGTGVIPTTPEQEGKGLHCYIEAEGFYPEMVLDEPEEGRFAFGAALWPVPPQEESAVDDWAVSYVARRLGNTDPFVKAFTGCTRNFEEGWMSYVKFSDSPQEAPGIIRVFYSSRSEEGWLDSWNQITPMPEVPKGQPPENMCQPDRGIGWCWARYEPEGYPVWRRMGWSTDCTEPCEGIVCAGEVCDTADFNSFASAGNKGLLYFRRFPMQVFAHYVTPDGWRVRTYDLRRAQ